MTRETRIAMLKNRMEVLNARAKDNGNIVKKIKRQIRNLGGN